MSVADSTLLNWPSREQEQLLRMLVAVPPARAALCDWLDRTALPVDADTSKLLPAIHLALASAGAERPLLTAHYRQTWVKNQRIVQGGIEAASLLRAANIPAAFIKGVPLCLFYHEDIGARPMADADLVVSSVVMAWHRAPLSSTELSGAPPRPSKRPPTRRENGLLARGAP